VGLVSERGRFFLPGGVDGGNGQDAGPTSGRPFVETPIDLSGKPQPPNLVHPWLYAGGVTVLQGEPGCGKSWLALSLSLQVMAGGGSVIYMDEEGGADLVTNRLYALGADPDLVDSNLHYFPFESRPWGDDDLDAVDELLARLPNARLVVFDSLPDFLAAAGLSEDSAGDVTGFVARVLLRFMAAGLAVLILDHLRKPEAGTRQRVRSRYARGSGAKLAKADAAILLEVVADFDATTSGRVQIWKTKDRRGALAIPGLGRSGLTIEVIVEEGSVEFQVAETADAGPAWDGPTECMEAIVLVLKALAPEEFSGNQLPVEMRTAGHHFRAETVRDGASRLAANGRIAVRHGPNNARLFSWKPTDSAAEEGSDEDF